MASAKAPFGTMHNQPAPSNRKVAEPAPWDRDPAAARRVPLASRSSSRSSNTSTRSTTTTSGGGGGGGSGKSTSRAAKDRQQVEQSSGARKNAAHPSSDKPAPLPVTLLNPRSASKVAGSTKTAPFGTAHNVPAPARKNAAPSKAPWERDDTQRFQKIAFGNLKSFGAFIRT